MKLLSPYHLQYPSQKVRVYIFKYIVHTDGRLFFIAGIGTLSGLNCTENDLAFLQRMQSIKKYEDLKVHNHYLPPLPDSPSTFKLYK